MGFSIATDEAGNKRVLWVIDVGPMTNARRAEHLFEVRETDLEGNLLPNIRDPVSGPLPQAEAIKEAEKYAKENGLRIGGWSGHGTPNPLASRPA